MVPTTRRPQLFQANARRFSSAKASTTSTASTASTAPKTRWTRNAAIAGAVSLPSVYIWWSLPGRDDIPDLRVSSHELPRQLAAPESGLSPDEVTRILSRDAFSVPVRTVAGLTRYDGAQLASNSPCEDRSAHGAFPSPRQDGRRWIAWAVLDGHAGWQTADLLSRALVPFVQHSLGQEYAAATKEGPALPDQVVQRAIAQGFLNLDSAIMAAATEAPASSAPLAEKVKAMQPAFAGSCALLSLYDEATRSLHVACTGDSRAVLGRQRADGTWEAVPLSIDQTGKNEDEIARLHAEHPGEDGIVKDGRVLGIMVSRAFGDGRWKWPLDFQQDIRRRFYAPSPLTPKYPVLTPPYLTAEPVVTTTKLDPAERCFLILATDGLWDHVSSRQAVDLVGRWLEPSKASTGGAAAAVPPPPPAPTSGSFDFGQFWNGVSWKFKTDRTVVQDDNAAVHLMRNGLGGNHQEMLSGRLAFDSPFSRSPRDDITVQVVLFNCAPGPPNSKPQR